jgi:hypothetical protein
VVGEAARLVEGERERRSRRHGMVEGAAVGGHGMGDALLLVGSGDLLAQLDLQGRRRERKLSMATAVPLPGVPAPLVVGAAVVVGEPPPYPPESPQPAASTAAATANR